MRPVLGFLTDHKIAQTACTCIVLREKTDETTLRRIAACELGPTAAARQKRVPNSAKSHKWIAVGSGCTK